MIKKIIIISTVLVILIPFIVLTIFLKEKKEELKEIDYGFISNQAVRVMRSEKNIIDNVPLEEYIVGVLSGEVPVTFELEAMKAQAVAARSYVLSQITTNKEKDYDVIDTVTNQVFLDEEYLKNRWKDKYIENINKIRQAVKETEGMYLVYGEEIVNAIFFSTSNGYTENSEDVFISALPYLRSVESVYDKEVSPVFNDTKIITLDEFYANLSLPYSDTLTVEIIKKSNVGRIIELKINGQLLNGREVYSSLKIRSTDFTITQDGKNVVIDTTGFGHGVGMSQYGAQGMALHDYKFDEILKHYYSGVEIKKI